MWVIRKTISIEEHMDGDMNAFLHIFRCNFANIGALFTQCLQKTRTSTYLQFLLLITVWELGGIWMLMPLIIFPQWSKCDPDARWPRRERPTCPLKCPIRFPLSKVDYCLISDVLIGWTQTNFGINTCKIRR